MKRLAYIGMVLALGCGGDDGKPASGGDRDGGGVTRDGGGGGELPPVTGTTRDGGIGLDGSVVTSGSTGEGGDAGVDGARVLSTLSTEERTTFCVATVGTFFAAVTLEDACTLESFVFSEDEAGCKEQVRDCVTARGSEEASNEVDTVQECVEGTVRCSATVAAFERCAQEATQKWQQITRAFSCGEVGKNEATEVPQPTLSDECTKLQNDCGGF